MPMLLDDPISLMKRRCSIRNHTGQPVDAAVLRGVEEFAAGGHRGPFGARTRMRAFASSGDSRKELKGLTTYGMIKGATAYLAGCVGPGRRNLEDYGYAMEAADLYLTGLGLGSCWLGGMFSKSAFARRMELSSEEEIPCVISFGPVDSKGGIDRVSERMKVRNRLAWEELFFESGFGSPLSREEAEVFAEPLEMVRLAPSASNKQPWRVVSAGGRFHFYLKRTKGYGKGTLVFRLLGISDLQRVDLGIAMCHFELAAAQLGLTGGWEDSDPGIAFPGAGYEYTATWVRG